MRINRLSQLGLFLATAGASLLLSGAAHADSADVSTPGQTNQSTSQQEVVVTGQSATTSSSSTQDISGQTATAASQPPAAPPTVAPPKDPVNSQPAADASSPSADQPQAQSTGGSAGSAPTGAVPGSRVSSPVPVPVILFKPVTIITPLIPQIVDEGGTSVVRIPVVQPAKPAAPELPSPTGALDHVTLALGQTTMPVLGFGGFAVLSRAFHVPVLLSVLMLAAMAFMTFATLLRRWGYAISARGSDPRLQLAFSFASPVMSELDPVRTMYPG